ncbi:MAG: peptidoglycan-associated lipoprotein Pal [Gammaproteobacteria bacterium]
MRGSRLLQLFGLVIVLGVAGCSTTPKDEMMDDSMDQVSDEVVESSPMESTSNSTYSASAGTTAEGEDNYTVQEDPDAALLRKRVFYFDFDQSVIQPEAYEALKAHARRLAADASLRVRLEGHADERGTREYNLALGERRGLAVAKFLRINGVSASQLDVISYGEEKPAVYGQGEQSWAQNRRVEISYR